jgi:SRSO17 transposase
MVPLAVLLGRSERRVAAASYVSGLLMPGQRKSIEPMAARLCRILALEAVPVTVTQCSWSVRCKHLPDFRPGLLGLALSL